MKKPTTFRLSQETIQMIFEISVAQGLSTNTDVVEGAIKAKHKMLKIPEKVRGEIYQGLIPLIAEKYKGKEAFFIFSAITSAMGIGERTTTECPQIES